MTSNVSAGQAMPNAARTQAERTATSTRRMLDATGELVLEQGFSNLTLAMIGVRAGYSRGLASMRFGSKENLLTLLVERLTRRWSERRVQPRIEGRPAIDAVLALIDEIRAQIERDDRSVRVLYTLMFEALSGSPALHEFFVEWNAGRRRDIEDALDAGVLDGSVVAGLDHAAEAGLIIAGLRGIAYQWVLDPDRFDPKVPLDLLASTVRARVSRPRAAGGDRSP